MMGAAYVYIAQAPDGAYKIGSSKDPAARIRKLDREVQIVRLIRQRCRTDAYQLERALHYFFQRKQIHGEWFRLDDSDFAQLEELDLAPPFDFTGHPVVKQALRWMEKITHSKEVSRCTVKTVSSAAVISSQAIPEPAIARDVSSCARHCTHSENTSPSQSVTPGSSCAIQTGVKHKPRVSMVQLRIRIPAELRDQIEAVAEKRKCQDAGNLSATVRFLLLRGLEAIGSNGHDGEPHANLNSSSDLHIA